MPLEMALGSLPSVVWGHVFEQLPTLDIAGINGASVLARQYATLAQVSQHFNTLVQPCWDILAEHVGEMIAACDLAGFINDRDHLSAWNNFYERMALKEYIMAHLASDHPCLASRKCPGLPTLGMLVNTDC